jgi:hypothetical protein
VVEINIVKRSLFYSFRIGLFFNIKLLKKTLHNHVVALLRICNTANNAQQYEDELFQGVIEFIVI